MAVLGKGSVLVTAAGPATVMVPGGEPVRERLIFRNFVSSLKQRRAQAKQDWRQGRMKLPAGDADEFAPVQEG
jgi:redox-sensitive bicupin YhaK (pirin superfamily)